MSLDMKARVKINRKKPTKAFRRKRKIEYII